MTGMCGSIPRSWTSQASVLGRAVGAVGGEPFGPEAEALIRPLDHGAGGGHLRWTDGGGRLDVDDDGVVEVDQVVGGIGEEGRSLVGAGPPRRGIRWRDELGRDLRRRPEGGVVQHRQILVDSSAAASAGRPVLARHAALTIGIGLDQAGIDGETFAADQALGDAAASTVSNSSRSRSLSRKRPCRFFEKVE